MSAVHLFRHGVIIGGGGAVGRLLTTALALPDVLLIDRQFPLELPQAQRMVADARDLPPAALDVIRACDLLILATPEEVAVAALPRLLACVPDTALIVETLSVKSGFAQRLGECGARCEVLGINPMFAPDLGFRGRSVIAVPHAARSAAAYFLELIATWGATTASLTAEQHDRACAALQAATHAAVLGFALALKSSGYDPRTMEAFLPPPHLTLLALAGRILAGQPTVYHDIQEANPFAATMRGQLREAQRQLEAAVLAGPEEFARQMEELRQFLARGSMDYAAICARLFTAL